MSIFSIVPEMKILSEIDRIIMKGHEAGPGDVGKLIRWLDHPNPEVRKAVAEAAAGEFLAGDYGLTAAVMRHVQTDASPEVREACIGHLGFAGVNHQHHADFEAEGERRPPDYDLDCPPQYQEVRELLAKIATNDKETENLRKAAIEELGHLGEDAAARRPVEAFLHHSAPGLRAAAVTAAGFWSSTYGLKEEGGSGRKCAWHTSCRDGCTTFDHRLKTPQQRGDGLAVFWEVEQPRVQRVGENQLPVALQLDSVGK